MLEDLISVLIDILWERDTNFSDVFSLSLNVWIA